MAKRQRRTKKKTSPRRTARRKTPARRVRRRVVTRKRVTRKRVVKRTPPKRKPPRHKKPKPPTTVEYQVNVSYRNKAKPGGAISLQFSVIGPPNLTKDQVIDAITETIAEEGASPKGFTVKIVSWKHGRVPRDVPWGSLGIIAGEPATRFSIQ